MANENRYYKTPFAESGNKAEVPDVSTGGAVGYDTGFGPDYELPQGSVNRKRIERDLYNGVLNGVTKNVKQWQEELYPTWIEDNGDGVAYSYPVGMIVDHAGQYWLSLEAVNQEEPGVGNKWIVKVSDINNLSEVHRFKTRLDMTTSTIKFPNGKRLETDENTTGNGGGAVYIVTDASTIPAPDQYGDHYIAQDTTQVAKILNKTGGGLATNDFFTEIDLAQYGMITDDDTQDWGLNLAAAMEAGSYIIVRGNYYCNNIRFPNKSGLKFVAHAGHWAGFTARAFGDSGYFAAPDLWLDNVASVNQPINFENIFFNGKLKGITLVIRWFYAIHDNLEIIDGVDHGILMTALSRDLTPSASTMVNNTFKNIEISGTSAVGWEITDDGKTTDTQITGGFVHNGGDVNVKFKTMAGTIVTGIHTYGSTINAEFNKMSGGTVVSGCYFEGGVTLQGAFTDWDFGTKNTVKGELLLQQNQNGRIRSVGNTIDSIRQDVFGGNRFTTKDDNFQTANPITFTNNSGGNDTVIKVENATIIGEFYEKSGILNPALGKIDVSFLPKGDLPMRGYFTVGGTNSISQDVVILERADNEAFSVEWSIGLRVGGTGANVLAAIYRYEIIKFSGTYYSTVVLSNINAGSFSSGPTLTIVDSGGNATINISASWTGSSVGIGNSVINVIDTALI